VIHTLTDDHGNILVDVRQLADGKPSVKLFHFGLVFDLSQYANTPTPNRRGLCEHHIRQLLLWYMRSDSYVHRRAAHMLQATESAPVSPHLWADMLLALEYWDKIKLDLHNLQ
jgi:hypothetical protein